MNKQLKKCFLFFVSTLAAMENQSPFDSLPNDVCRLILTKTVTPDTFRNSALVDIATVMNAQLQETSKEIPNILTTICNERLGIISSPLFLVNKQFYRVLKQMTKQQYVEIHTKAILDQYPNFSNYYFSELFNKAHLQMKDNNYSLFEDKIPINKGKSYVQILLNQYYNTEEYSVVTISKDLSSSNDDPNEFGHISKLRKLAEQIQYTIKPFGYHLKTTDREETLSLPIQNTKGTLTSLVCESWILLLIECHELKFNVS